MMITESATRQGKKGKNVQTYSVIVPAEFAPVLRRKEPIHLTVVRRDMDLTTVVKSQIGKEHLHGMRISDLEACTFSKVNIKESRKPSEPLPISFSTVLVHGKEDAREFEKKLEEFIAGKLKNGVTSSNVSSMLRKDD